MLICYILKREMYKCDTLYHVNPLIINIYIYFLFVNIVKYPHFDCSPAWALLMENIGFI